MKKINIGITVSIENENHLVWTNGITQNVINLARVLKNCNDNHNVYVLNVKKEKPECLPWGVDLGINCHSYDEIKDDTDILFVLGAQIYLDWGEYLRAKGCKIISYHCGSNYIIDMEKCIHGNEENPNPMYPKHFDETWVIPQNENLNLYYYKTMERCSVARVVPFVWDSYFIDKVLKENSLPNNGCYRASSDKKRLAIIEPNINVVKYCMYPLLIAEKLYREDKELIKHIYVTNALKLKTNKYFIKLMNHFDIAVDNLTSFEGRYITPYFLSTYADVVVSHQWENPLNYAYLDAMYLRFPLVHNAHMIKDAGYYYEGNNVDEGAKVLRCAIENHDNNMDEYDNRSEVALNRYSIYNPAILEEYRGLINNVLS